MSRPGQLTVPLDFKVHPKAGKRKGRDLQLDVLSRYSSFRFRLQNYIFSHNCGRYSHYFSASSALCLRRSCKAHMRCLVKHQRGDLLTTSCLLLSPKSHFHIAMPVAMQMSSVADPQLGRSISCQRSCGHV